MITKEQLQKAKIREFIRLTNSNEKTTIAYLEGEEWDLDDTLMDYRAFYGIRTGR